MRIITLRKLDWWYSSCSEYCFQVNKEPTGIGIRLVHGGGSPSLYSEQIHVHHLSVDEVIELKDMLEEWLAKFGATLVSRSD